MIDVASITATASVVSAVILNKAIEKGGENFGDTVSNKIGQIINFIRDKFKKEGVEVKLLKAQEHPSRENKDRFRRELTELMEYDENFDQKLVELKEQLENLEGGHQIIASGLELEGNLKAKDIKQKGSQHQEMFTNVKAKDIDFDNLSQEN